MKKILYTLLAGALALSSCSKSEDAAAQPQTGDQLSAFIVEAPSATRASVTGLTRYIVEAYEAKDLTATPARAESATGVLSIVLKKNTDYTFVFWADKGTANANTGYWDAVKLQQVKVAAGKEHTPGEAAYCLTVSFNSKDFEANKTIMLKNATAQVNFIEGTGLVTANNSLTVKYAAGATLNVATGRIAEVAGEVTHTFTGIVQAAKDATLATDYVLAPLGEQNILGLKLQFNSESEKVIDNVPFQQNHKTSIRGEYSNLYTSTFTISNEVDDYENSPDVEFPTKAKVVPAERITKSSATGRTRKNGPITKQQDLIQMQH